MIIFSRVSASAFLRLFFAAQAQKKKSGVFFRPFWCVLCFGGWVFVLFVLLGGVIFSPRVSAIFGVPPPGVARIIFRPKPSKAGNSRPGPAWFALGLLFVFAFGFLCARGRLGACQRHGVGWFSLYNSPSSPSGDEAHKPASQTSNARVRRARLPHGAT